MDDQFLQPVLIPQQYPYTSPVTQYQQYGGPYAEYGNTVPCLSEQELRSLQMYDERNNIDAESAIRIDEAKMYHKLEVERWKAVWQKQLMDAREEYQRKRESMTTAVIFDSQGMLRREIRYDKDDNRLTAPLCNLCAYRLVLYTALEAGPDDFVLEISARNLKRPILLNSSKIEASDLQKKLRSRGVSVNVPRRDIKNTLDEMLALFVHYAIETEVPFTSGWCLTTDGWSFKKDLSGTFLGKRKEADHDA